MPEKNNIQFTNLKTLIQPMSKNVTMNYLQLHRQFRNNSGLIKYTDAIADFLESFHKRSHQKVV